MKSDKSLLSPETRFRRRKTAEDDNVKINVSLNISRAFLFISASAFFQMECK